MLTVVSDTHSQDGHRLRGRTLEAVREADLVVHAGDFNAEAVLDAFEDEAVELLAVYGNTDDAGVRARLPAARHFDFAGVRFALTHTRRGGAMGLTLFGHEQGADAVISGHTHRPSFDDDGPLALLNPGSHAQPRGNRAAHAELVPGDDGLDGRLVTPDGTVFERFHLPVPDDS